MRCQRCNRELKAKKSIERGYGLMCYRLVQMEKKNNSNEEIMQTVQFLKMEFKFLKRQFTELKS